MNYKNITIVINRSSGELEWMLPLLWWFVNDCDIKMTVLFLRKKELNYCHRSPFIMSILTHKNVQLLCYESYRTEKNRFVSMIIKGYVFITKSYQWKQQREFNSCLNQLVRKTNINKYSGLVFLDNSFYQDLSKNKLLPHSILKILKPKQLVFYPHGPWLDVSRMDKNGLAPHLGESVRKDTVLWQQYSQLAQASIVISDSKELAMQYHETRGLKAIYIGCPKYQSWWLDQLSKKKTKRVDNKVLILSKLQGSLLKANSSIEPENLIKEIISVLEARGADWQIKLHPRDDAKVIKEIIETVSVKPYDECIYSGGIYDLKSDFDVCISIPTSAVLDTVSLAIPTVEYYYDHANTKQSAYRYSGLVYPCSNKNELNDFFTENIVEGNLSIDGLAIRQRKIFDELYADGVDARENLKVIMN